ncbi:hypothetical protein, partial [Treponema endosymbiont of Eucomonympha sp.]|uniref:hypothetical protein n=1 Tax=Treponema endosymbiont of Eucomonympha sp. TaxID=1580831 RepID=UPI00164FD0C9
MLAYGYALMAYYDTIDSGLKTVFARRGNTARRAFMPHSNISGTVGFFTDKPNVIDTANASADKPIAIKIISNKPTQSA